MFEQNVAWPSIGHEERPWHNVQGE